MTLPRRLLRLLAPVLLCAGATAVLAGAPADAQSGRCAPGTGVTVVVDYAPLGGGTPIGCDPSGAGKPASQVVPAAGFTLYYVNGEAFVCSIDKQPNPKQACQHTPPDNAYWGLFWSDGKSATWKYSSTGVTGLTVPKGGSIGWRFENGGALENPSQPPTQNPPKPTPSPTPSPKPSHTPRASPSTAPKPSGPSAEPTGSTPPASSRPPAVAAGTTTPSPSRTAAVAPPSGGHGGHGKAAAAKAHGHAHVNGKPKPRHRPNTEQVTASPRATAATTSGPGQAVLTAVAASSVVLLGAAVGVAGWRRRS